MSWYRHYLLWMAGGAGAGYLVGTQKKLKLKHEEFITVTTGAITGLVLNKAFNHFVPAGERWIKVAGRATKPAATSGELGEYVKPPHDTSETAVEQAPPIPYDTSDDNLPGGSISDGSMLSWDEDEDDSEE